MKPSRAAALFIAIILFTGCSTLRKSDSTALQGTWLGREVGRPAGDVCRLTIKGNALEYQGANKDDWTNGTFSLREDDQPKQLVGTITECGMDQYVGKTVFAIYKLEAGTLTLAGSEPGSPEIPTSFDAPGTRQFIFTKN
jgi:uncharacterized protein (TIGR03067 family)